MKHEEADAGVNVNNDFFGFEDVMKDAPGLKIGLDVTGAEAEHDLELAKEVLENYKKDWSSENKEMLEAKDRKFLRKVYSDIIEEYPILRHVKLEDVEEDTDFSDSDQSEGEKKHKTFFYPAGESEYGPYIPGIKYDFSHKDAYLEKRNPKDGKIKVDYASKMLALRTGADGLEVVQNEHLMSAFVLLHEFGHAKDFLDNFLGAEALKSGAEEFGNSLTEALEKYQDRKTRDEMGHVVPYDVLGKRGVKRGLETFASRMEALGLDPKTDDILEKQHKWYRDRSSEMAADDFAFDYIAKHYDDFFGNTEQDLALGKARSYLGKFEEIEPEDIDILKLDASKSVRLIGADLLVNEAGNLQFLDIDMSNSVEGFLNWDIKVGKEMEILRDSDVTRPNNCLKSPTVRGVGTIPRKDRDGNLTNYAVIRFEEKLPSQPHSRQKCCFIELTGKQPKEIDVSPEKMMEDLKIGVGSRVALMKRELFKGSQVKLGEMIEGVLMDSGSESGDSPIRIGHGIYLSSWLEEGGEQPLTVLNVENTSSVNRVFRKWRSYYVETETSTYEVMKYKAYQGST